MKKKIFTLLMLTGFAFSALAQSNFEIVNGVPVDRSKFPDYDPVGTPDWSLMENGLARKGMKEATELPDHWNNAETKYFPPVFNQAGGSCGPSSRIGYMLTHELNAYRGTDASLAENRLPPNFVYPFSYNGSSKDQLAIATGVPSMKVYGGFPYSSIYGFCEADQSYGGWMQGYEKWHHAMYNRLASTSNFPVSVGSEEGRQAVKRWLYNHNGDESFKTGGIVGLGCAANGMGQGTISSTAANRAAGVNGMKYLTNFGPGVDHAITLVGWDDRIEFDLDNNGTYGESNNSLGQNETGAWIIVNSWGGWANGGFIYVPYPLATPVSEEVTANGKKAYKAKGGYWTPEIYKIRKDYVPKRTIKAKLSYTQRSAISLSAGISTDLTALKPEKTVTFHHFNYQGDADKVEGDAMMPMLGQWADGQKHYEPMEMGYDLTDLSAGFDQSRPLKYFFIITSKSNAQGAGGIHAASIMDYTINEEGVETPFKIELDSVTIQNGGKQTIISVIVNGEGIKVPVNLSLNGSKLIWEAPAGSARQPEKYEVYCNNVLVGTATACEFNIASANAGDRYTVKAVYNIDGRTFTSDASASVSVPNESLNVVDSIVGEFENGGLIIPDIFSQNLSQATIEFRIKPSSLANWNQQIGPNWGSFLIHSTSAGAFVYGWDTGSNRNEVANVLRAGSWTHCAVVVDGSTMTLYVNGQQKGTFNGSGSGLGGFGDLEFGSHLGANNGLFGQIDEIRIWGEARARGQVSRAYNYPLFNPTQYGKLLAYYKMDTIVEDGVTKFRDCVGGHHAAMQGTASSKKVSATGLRASVSLAASIINPGTITVGEAVTLTDQSTPDVVRREWQVDGKTYTSASPVVVFSEPGEKEVKLTVFNPDGASAEATRTLTVEAGETATADFELSTEAVSGSDRISFLSQNRAIGCSYLWEMPGAEVETATTANASAKYNAVGTYTVKLTVTTPAGQQLSSSKQFEVLPASPVANFEIPTNIVMVGDTVRLRDNSSYAPTSAKWIFTSKQAQLSSFGLFTNVVPKSAGTYSLKYKVANEYGYDEIEAARALVVCNADSKQGLNFGGDNQKLTATTAPTGITTAWTIDFWFRPSDVVDASTLGLNSGANGFVLRTGDDGALNFTLGSETATSPSGFILAGDWHHYAVSFNNGTLRFLRDGDQLGSATIQQTDFSSVWNGLQIGGSEHPTKGMMDEFRLFSKQVTTSAIRRYAVAPVTDVVSTTDRPYLQIYYDFNQDSGNAADNSGNGNTGVRSGFGPDGDAWQDSKGVFALNFSGSSAAFTPLGSRINTRSGYTVIGCSDEETSSENAQASKALDYSESTFWHSMYSTATSYPHSITIQRTDNTDIESIMLYYSRAQNYRAASLLVEQSADGENWKTCEDDLALANEERPGVVLLKPITESYIRLTFKTGYGSYLALNEIYFYGGLIAAGIDDGSILINRQPTEGAYDLQGRRVAKTVKGGIYIVDGKKIFVK